MSSLITPHSEQRGNLAIDIMLFDILQHLAEFTVIHTYIHSYTDGGGCHARFRPAHQEQLPHIAIALHANSDAIVIDADIHAFSIYANGRRYRGVILLPYHQTTEQLHSPGS